MYLPDTYTTYMWCLDRLYAELKKDTLSSEEKEDIRQKIKQVQSIVANKFPLKGE